MNNIYWDFTTLILYLSMGVVAAFCTYKVKLNERKTGHKQRLFNRYYLTWYIFWIIIAVYRKVEFGMGGQDALKYKIFFETCFIDGYHYYYNHVEILYKLFNQFIRLFTSNYHVLFFLVYSIIIISYIYFINEFMPKDASSVPIIFLVYNYLLSLNTLRTSLSVALILIGMVFLFKGKTKTSLLFAISTVFIQKASIFFIFFWLVYYLDKKKHIEIIDVILGMGIIVFISNIIQKMIISINFSFLETGAYRYYAKISLNKSFLDNFWKISFFILVLLVFICIFYKPIKAVIDLDNDNKKRMHFIMLICYTDFLLLPIAFKLNIWRVSEYFLLARLIMWGYIFSRILMITNKKRQIFLLMVSVCFVLFVLINRIEAIYSDSAIMPYVFDFFGK